MAELRERMKSKGLRAMTVWVKPGDQGVVRMMVTGLIENDTRHKAKRIFEFYTVSEPQEVGRAVDRWMWRCMTGDSRKVVSQSPTSFALKYEAIEAARIEAALMFDGVATVEQKSEAEEVPA